MAQDFSKFYEELLAKLPLLDKHREELKTKRGFTDDAINTLKFRSCSKELFESLEAAFRKQLPAAISNSLCHENILIPYLDPSGACFHLRPHKFGFQGQGIRSYVPHAICGDDFSTVVLAESEFKAVASCLYGVPAIGVPGISSFSREHFPELKLTLAALGVKNVIICFDNEIKDDPRFPNYKADPTKRFDTQFYAFVMAQLIKKSEIKSKIAVLPKEWMFQGKIDIDGALAKKMPAEDYKKCLYEAVDAYAYKNTWDLKGISKSYLERKIEKFFYPGPIEEKFNSYYYKSENGSQKITNFIIKVYHTMFGENGTERFCQFISDYGNSNPVKLTPEVMASKGSFVRFCYENGDYRYEGTDPQLQKIWAWIFMNQSGKIVNKLTNYGYNAKYKMWSFDNGIYYNDKFYPANSEGIVWIDEEGYKLFDNLSDSLMAPKLESENPGFTLNDIFERFQEKLGRDHARLLIGWALGNFFMPEIIKEWDTFPFLFLNGKLGSGKSAIANWISSFFGFSLNKGIPFSGSSVVGISRITSQMGMLPVWLEEYRNKGDPFIAGKNSFLRSIYDKSTIIKGSKNPDEIKTYTARSTIILSGEEPPNDAALNSRCIQFGIFSKNRASDEGFQWINKHKSTFNYFGHYILTNKATLWPKVLATIMDYMQGFKNEKVKISPRTAMQMSIISGICDVFLGDSDTFTEFVGDFAEDKESKVELDQALTVFWDDIINMYNLGKLNDVNFYEFRNDIEDVKHGLPAKQLWVQFNVLYAAWEQFYKNLRNDIPAAKKALCDHLNSEDYVVCRKAKRFKWGIQTGYCLDWNHKNFPEMLKNFFEQLEEGKYVKPVEQGYLPYQS